MTYIKPGIVELYTGPMNSRKTAAILDRVDQLNYLKERNFKTSTTNRYDFIFAKPTADTRDAEVKSRGRNITIPCIKISPDKPYDLISTLESYEQEKGIKYSLVAIDEVQFFHDDITDVIVQLQKENRNLVLAGLDLDFRGEPFGPMGKISLIANEIYKLTAVCQYPDCITPATRTQRLINGLPAKYSEPTLSIEGSNNSENYESRCLEHHFVPR